VAIIIILCDCMPLLWLVLPLLPWPLPLLPRQASECEWLVLLLLLLPTCEMLLLGAVDADLTVVSGVKLLCLLPHFQLS
jgi:hypothetical protein